ncbi:M48 family metallopeptidase [Antarcticirhabdus aurantiaca]|uniref:M48 family metallopeptidase n=1 Tax=Antarcticirhabdus aurantiaca TaxID=2606717 RepID=A0ACD4NMF3_9HYPH|nr:M48 family metallopeptidase [Antarcticirhabdus aurantiaca]WAJ27860.1 M48 family metallopeptidase [Jeongeuplla avenae]
MYIITFIIAVLSAAWTLVSGWQTVPHTGRWQLIGVDAKTSATLGEQAFDEVLTNKAALTQGPDIDAVQRVLVRLAPHAKELMDQEVDWDFAVLEDPTPNAFALPNGNLAVQTGLLPITGLDDGLAAVIGHEMAHVIARHPEERLTQQEFARLGQFTASLLVGDIDPAAQVLILEAFGLGTEFGLLRPFSRSHESEADRIGMLLMARACYDPRVAPELWERMEEAPQSVPEILSTHPTHQTRMADLSANLNEALEARTAAGCPPLSNSVG